MPETIKISVEAKAGIIVLNRPEKRMDRPWEAPLIWPPCALSESVPGRPLSDIQKSNSVHRPSLPRCAGSLETAMPAIFV